MAAPLLAWDGDHGGHLRGSRSRRRLRSAGRPRGTKGKPGSIVAAVRGGKGVEAWHWSGGYGREVSIIIETHSEALVNGLGDFVESKDLSPEDVQIVLFEQDAETRETKLRIASYDEDGALRNWPFGFFAAVTPNNFAITPNE